MSEVTIAMYKNAVRDMETYYHFIQSEIVHTSFSVYGELFDAEIKIRKHLADYGLASLAELEQARKQGEKEGREWAEKVLFANETIFERIGRKIREMFSWV